MSLFSFVLFLNLEVLGQLVTSCILLMRLEPVLPPNVYPVEQMAGFPFE